MKFGPVLLDAACGGILAHSLLAGSRRIAKGSILDDDAIAALSAAGVTEVVVAMLEEGDVHEDSAANAIAASLAGTGVVAEPAAHGRANLSAAHDGLALVDAGMVGRVNAIDEALTLATVSPFARVRRGDVVGTVKVIPFAAAAANVEAAARQAAAMPLAVAPFMPKSTVLVQTMLGGTSAKLIEKTAEVTRRRVEALGAQGFREVRVEHDAASVADALSAALAAGADLLLVAGASAITDRRDVIPAAIVRAGGRIERLGMPVEPGNLLCLGAIGAVPVIGLPGCARSPKRNGFDWVLERLVAGLKVTDADIGGMGLGGLLADVPRPEPRRTAALHAKAGAVVLAGGRSVRMGANKLLADLGGRPVLAHVLAAVGSAGLDALVVTGNAAAEVAAIAGDVPTIHAPRFAEGLSQTLAAGIRAVPADWGAALIVLGDMPEVGPEALREIAAAARHDRIVVPVHAGRRGNPVAWGRDFFEALAAIEGDIGGKALLGSFTEAIEEVEIADAGILTDVDTPEALAAVRERWR